MPDPKRAQSPKEQAGRLERFLLLELLDQSAHDHSLLQRMATKMTVLDDKLTQLESDVTAETTVEQSAVTLLTGISQQLKDIIAAGGDPAAQLARVAAVSAALEASTADLAAAVTANTPAA